MIYLRRTVFYILPMLMGIFNAQAGEIIIKNMQTHYQESLLEIYTGITPSYITIEDGYHWLVVTFEAEADFSKDQDEVKINKRDMYLMTEAGDKISGFAEYRHDGVAIGSPQNISIRYRKNQDKRPAELEGIAFPVPTELKRFELNLGGQKFALKDIPERAAPKPTDFAKFEITGSSFVDGLPENRLDGKARYGEERLLTTTRYKNIAGRFLRVALNVKPTKANAYSTNQYDLDGLDLAIVSNGSTPYAPWMFPRSNDHGFVKNGSVRLYDYGEGFQEGEIICYFLVAPDLDAYELYYRGEKIGSAQVGK